MWRHEFSRIVQMIHSESSQLAVVPADTVIPLHFKIHYCYYYHNLYTTATTATTTTTTYTLLPPLPLLLLLPLIYYYYHHYYYHLYTATTTTTVLLLLPLLLTAATKLSYSGVQLKRNRALGSVYIRLLMHYRLCF